MLDEKEAARPEATNEISIHRILNPFNPRDFVSEVQPWISGRTIAEYFPLGSVSQIVSVNGRIIPADEFKTTYLDCGDNVVTCPIPQGGGDDKSILSMVAMIAVAVFAPQVALAMNGAMGLGLASGSLGMAMLTAGVTMAGSLIVQSIFAPSKPTEASEKSTTSYGVDGAKNTSLEGVPVPINYGKFRMGGNIVGMHVMNDGDTQLLYMLINAGEGPVASITDIELDDNPVGDYKDVEVQVRLGTPNQASIPWFDDTIVPISKNLKLTTNWITHTTDSEVDKLRLDFSAPSGLFKINKGSAATEEVTVGMEIQYRMVGDTAWTGMSLQNVVTGSRGVEAVYDTTAGSYDQDGNFWRINPQTGEQERYTPVTTWKYTDTNAPVSEVDLAYIQDNYDISVSAATVPTYSQAAEMKAAKRSAVRRSYESGRLEQARYEVRCRRTTAKSTEENVSDEIYLTDVNEILMEPMSYPNTALVGVKIKLGEQINNVPRVTFLHGGKVISVFGKPFDTAPKEIWHEVASTNPAWIVWDILTNRRYGGGMPTSRLDFYAFKRLAQRCLDANLDWNGPIDSQMNVWDATQYVLRAGHAQIVNVGTRWTVVSERPASPVMMFSVANMVENTYRETWLPVNDRANEVDVTFFDKEDKYKQRTIKVYDPVALTAGSKQRTSAVTLYGVVDYERAYQEGMFMMNLNRFILKTISFSAPMEAIACTVGDLIYVQHDMPNWAQAGRLEAGSTSSVLKLDRPVNMEIGKTYKVLLHRDSVVKYSGTISAISGDFVTLTGFANLTQVDRLKTATRDVRVLEVYDNGSVVVESTDGLAVGNTYELHALDVIEERSVVLNPGDQTTVTLQSALTSAPRQYTQWMFGETTKVKKPFRIRSISGSAEYTREIQAVQYDERVYQFDRFASQHVPIDNPGTPVISQVRNLEAYEETRISGSQIVSDLTVAWRAPQVGIYQGADIYVQRNDGPLVKTGEVKHATSVQISATRGERIKVKVVAFDLFNLRASLEGAPEVTHTVIGEVSDIDVGEVTGADVLWSGRDCRLIWRYNSTTHSYEFGSEPAGADSGSLDPQFKDYEIRVYNTTDTDGARPRRVEHTTDNSYTYTYDKNFADGISRHLRFEIRMRDIFNNLGNPATLTATNPPPTLTGFSSVPTFESANISYTHSNDPDFAGARIWMSDTEEDVTGDVARAGFDDLLVYDGPDSSVNLTGLMFNQDYYLRIAPYDAFGKSGLVPSNVIHFKTTFLNVNAIAEGVLSGSVLAPGLMDRIDLIDGPASLTGSVAQRLTQEALARANAIADEAAARVAAITSEANSRIAAINAEAASRAAAISGEASARTAAITAETNARAAALAEEAAARGAAVTAEATARQNADSSIAANVATVTAATNANTAAISAETTARTNADTAISASITTLTSTVDANTAAISSEATTRANADTAIAGTVTALTSTVNGHTAAITSEATTRANADSALSASITTLSASVGSQINAAITTEAAARASGDSAIANSISALETSVASNAASILAEQTARSDGDSALASSVTALQASAASNAAAVTAEATARANGDSALAATITTVQSSVASANAAISAEAATRASADSALSTTISTVQANVASNSAAIASEATTRANADGALATSITAVQAAGATNAAGIAAANAAITAEQTARIDGDASLASSITSIQANVASNAAAITAEATARANADSAISTTLSSVTATTNANTAAIASETTARVSADTSLANSITALTTTVSGNTSAIANEVTARTDAVSSLASSITSLQASTASNAAAIASEATARANADTATATTLSGLSANVSANTAAINNEAGTRANETSALSYSISQLTSTVGGHTTTIGTHVAAINGLSGQFTVKIDNNGYVSGFGLASYSTTTGITSEFIIRADKFAMIMPGYSGVYPFTIGAVNGIPRVVISSAIIGDASIQTAHIGNLVVQTHNIDTGACTAAFSASSGGTDAVLWFTVPANCASFVVTAQTGYAFGSTGSGENYVELIDPAPCNIYVNGIPASVTGAGSGSAVVINPTAGSTQVVVNRSVTSPYNGTYGGSINFVVMLYKR